MGKVKFILINFFISILFSTGLGQIITAEEIENLQEIKVTSSRDTFTAENFPGSLTIITAEDIQKKQHLTVESLLRGELGLDVARSGSLGGQTSVFIRGQGGSSTLTIIDGVRVNPNSTTYDWGDLITGNIERIEVLKGPQSIQWGADAKGGVINIITKKGKGKPQHAFTFEGGSFATFKESIQTSGSINNISYSIFGQHLYSDGFSSVNDQAPRGGSGGDGTINKTISTRLGYEFSKNTDMEFVGRYIKSNDELDDSFNRVDSSASNNVDEFSVSLPFKTSFSGCGDCFFQMWDVKLTPSLYYKHALTIGVTTRSVSVDRTLTMDLQNNVFLNNNLSLLFGVEYEHQNAMAHESADQGFGVNEGYHALVDNYAGYLQSIFQYQNRLILTAGFRKEFNTAFGNVLTYKLEGGYNFESTGTRLNTSFATGFRAPTFDELYFPAVDGFLSSNPSLIPEKIKSFEIGLKQGFLNNRLQAGLTFFNTVTTNFIQSNESFVTDNFGKFFSQGLETAINIKLPQDLSVSINHTWNNHWIDEDNAAESVIRRPAIRRAKHKFRANLNHNWNNKLNSLLGIYVRGEAFDSSSRNNTGAFTTIRAAFKYKYNKNLALTFRGENLLDEDYEEVGPFGTAGISGYAGFIYSFK